MSGSRRLTLSFVKLALGLMPVGLLAGCSDPPPSELKPSSGSGAVLNEAERLLTRMIEAYAKADGYADRGELRISGNKQGKRFDDTVPFALVLERPNKIYLRIYGATLISDGATLWAWSDDLPGHILKRSAPKALTLAEIYADDTLRTIFGEGVAGRCLPLEMLLGADAMDLFRAGGARPELLSNDYSEGSECRRVRVRRDDGDFIYWIDARTQVLRRIDFPTRRVALTLADPYPPTDLRMYAELVDPQFNPTIPAEAYQFEAPPQVKIVDKLDLNWASPPPQPPADVLGSKPASFTLRTLDGRSLTSAELAGKPTVLVFWDVASSECLHALSTLQEAYSKLPVKDELRILAVSINPGGDGGISDEDLRRELTAAKIHLPGARDIDNSALRALGARFVPSFYLLDRDTTVQDNEVGFHRGVAELLPTLLADLAAGKPMVQACRDRYAARVRQFEETQKNQTVADAAMPQAKLAPKSNPTNLKLAEVWKSTEIKQPGYVLATDEKDGPPRILVVDGLKSVAELDAAGKLKTSHALDLPKEPEGIVGFLRTAVDKAGKRVFVGSLSSQQQLHLFDSDFKRLLSFPEGSHAGISDVQLGDLDGDGEPEMCVGYWGLVGLQGVSLDGIRKWANRQLPENVLRTAITGKDSTGKRLVLCATGVMTVAIVDEQGQTLREMPVGGRAVRLVAAADLTGDGSAELCAIAAQGPGNDTAVGFDGTGRELWSYPLPKGVQPVPQMQNEMLVGGPVFDEGPGAWLIAGADGTLHIVGHDGKPIDSFGWGKAIHGLATARIDGRATILVSDAETVTAFRLQR
ncbi:MAG: redoxin domain-containing protein [Pirellulales bacterium]